MSTKLLSIFSLLLLVNLVNGDTNDTLKRKEYIKYYKKAEKDAKKARENEENELKNLLETEDGKPYKASLEQWHICMRNNSDDFDKANTRCKDYAQALENELKILQETPAYDEYRNLLGEDAYHENLKSGLHSILWTDYSYRNWEDEEKYAKIRAQRLQDAIEKNTIGEAGKASNMFIRWSKDIREDEERAHEELRRIVAEVEGSENQESENQEEE